MVLIVVISCTLGGALGDVIRGPYAGTLGAVVCGAMWFCNTGDCTLGTGAIGIGVGLGMFYMRLSCVVSVTSAFHIGSPAAKLSVVVDGGCVKMVIISPATCTKNFSI